MNRLKEAVKLFQPNPVPRDSLHFPELASFKNPPLLISHPNSLLTQFASSWLFWDKPCDFSPLHPSIRQGSAAGDGANLISIPSPHTRARGTDMANIFI